MLSNKAKKQLRGLEQEIRARVDRLLEKLEQEPVPYQEYDLKKLEDRDENYRVRLSSFRVVYWVRWTEKTVWIAKIERRSENTY